MLNFPRGRLVLFWASLWMLFFEILMIRWLSAEVRIFSYFHNLVILFCFLGIGLGFARPERTPSWLPTFAGLAMLAAWVAFDAALGPASIRTLSLYLSRGFEYSIWDAFRGNPLGQLGSLATGTLMLGSVLAILTAMFIPFGRLVGALFNESERPLVAYGVNLAGSLAGVWLFAMASALATPPWMWFLAGLGAALSFSMTRRQRVVASALGLAAVLSAVKGQLEIVPTVWSPYQKLAVVPIDPPGYGALVMVNGVRFMGMSNYSPEFTAKHPELFPPDEMPYDHYNLPYRFAQKPRRVLIVGSGGGNDIASAFRHGAERVTAVDIDPVIVSIGRARHPERPYENPACAAVIDDARSFFRTYPADGPRFDLIVFGLLDSHTLSSSFSNVRLDNYVYTRESFAEARKLLAEDGLMVVAFAVLDGYIGSRLYRMLTEVFGEAPTACFARSRFWEGHGHSFLCGNRPLVERALGVDPKLRELVDKERPTVERWVADRPYPCTDDWPYLYLEGRSIPGLHLFLFALLFGGCAAVIRRTFGERRAFNGTFFFLGAGFLLIEVQSISRLALLFGTTWWVNTVVVSAVLIMILAANVCVLRLRPAKLAPYYAGLFAALALNLAVPIGVLGEMGGAAKALIAGGLMALPLFFAGVIFSTLFQRTVDRSQALAWNLLGAMLGGMLESLSFLFGIAALLVVAAVLYGLSAVRGIGMQNLAPIRYDRMP